MFSASVLLGSMLRVTSVRKQPSERPQLSTRNDLYSLLKTRSSGIYLNLCKEKNLCECREREKEKEKKYLMPINAVMWHLPLHLSMHYVLIQLLKLG